MTALRHVADGTRRRLRVAVLGPSRFPLSRPFAGGQEAFTATLCERLRRRGHHVVLFALDGSDPGLADEFVPYAAPPSLSAVAQVDPGMPAGLDFAEHHAFLDAVRVLGLRTDIDVVHNNSLHPYPIALADLLPAPMVTTLHTPPIPFMESAAAMAGRRSRHVAVSGAVARTWTTLPGVEVVSNGVDVDAFLPGPGGGGLAWAGRVTPEKGTHLAIETALRLDLPLRIAGPISDPDYFARSVRPLLDERRVYVGHLDTAALREHYAAADVLLVTPLWEEPFGLVAAEAMACGTPVAGFGVGGLTDVVGAPEGGAVVDVPAGIHHTSHDEFVTGLAAAVGRAAGVSRATVRLRAEREFAAATMIGRYERIYAALARRAPAEIDGIAG
ncbi:glycosyltransferase [Agilicoccus flavus]|uniref:glycosyltransferase n=1 Tax=Agilicoccus flavus TaxID=2775968 RepID=UPI001CF706E9|nr:glycosyltransferase [Agilicoccus flavus]